MSLSNSINASFESIENALKLNDTIQQSADSLVLLKAKLTSDPKCSPQVYKQIEDVVGQLEVVKVAAPEATDRMDKALEATISAREKTVANSKAKTSKPASKGSQTTSKSNSGGGALPKVKIGCGRPNCKLLHKYQAKQAARNAAQPNSLPDKVLERIFATLDTGTLMSCRWVTKRWRTLVQKVLCEKGKVLKLAIICKDASKEFIRSRTQDTKKYGGGFLRTDSTASRNFHYLKKSFPDVTKLDILFISPLDLQPLLRNWSSMLTTLTLRQIPAAIFDKLTRTLANIATLRELHLLHLGETTIPECTTILRQLECFTLLGYRGPIQAVLRSLGDKLTHLTLDHVVCTSFDLFKLVADTDITLCPSVTHLTLGELFVPVGDEKWATTNYLEILTLIGYSMSSLKHFELHFASEVIPPSIVNSFNLLVFNLL